MILNSNAFVAGVMGLARIGRAARGAYLQRLREQDVLVLVPHLRPVSDAEREKQALADLLLDHMPLVSSEAGAFFGLYDLDEEGEQPVLRSDQEELRQAAIKFVYSVWRARESQDITIQLDGFFDHAVEVPALVALTHKDWEADTGSGIAHIAYALADTVLNVAAEQPGLLGLNQSADAILKGMRPAISQFMTFEWNKNEASSRELASTFFSAALHVAIRNPGLITSDEKLLPLVEGVLLPLQASVEENGALGFLARDRIREFFEGPLARSLIQTLDSHSDLYLRGEFSKQKLLGMVVRGTLSDFVSIEPSQFKLSDVISEASAVSLVDNLLTTLGKQPDLIVQGKGDIAESLRTFIQSAAPKLRDAPRPFQWSGGLSADLIGEVLNSAADLASARLRKRMFDPNPGNGDDKEWNDIWVETADQIIQGFVEGLKSGLDDGAMSGRDVERAFETLFSRKQAVGLVKAISANVASYPELILRDGSEVSELASVMTKGIAQAIASDDMNLLRGEDWFEIATLALQLAAENPDTLFIRHENSSEEQIAVTLIRKLLASAAEQMRLAQESGMRDGGKFLFGITLRRAILATLDVAAQTVLAAFSRDQQEERLEALSTFVETLRSFTTGETFLVQDGADEISIDVRLGPKDWLAVYKHFLAHIIQHGPDDQIEAADIVKFVHDLEPDILVTKMIQNQEAEG